MNSTKTEEKQDLISTEQIETMKIILDKENKIDSDERLAELGKIFTEDE